MWGKRWNGANLSELLDTCEWGWVAEEGFLQFLSLWFVQHLLSLLPAVLEMPGLVSVSGCSFQGEVWVLQLMFQNQWNYPDRDRTLHKGWGTCLGFGNCWSHLRKSCFLLGMGVLPLAVFGLCRVCCAHSVLEIWVLLTLEIFSWCALTVCHLPYWGNQESGVPWKMILGKKLSLFLWHTFETRKPCNVCTLLSFKSSLCDIFSQGNVYILNFHFWREDFLLPLLAGFGVLVTLLGRGDVDKLHGRV